DPDIVRVVYDTSDQVLERISEEAHACSCLSDASSFACALSEEPESASSVAAFLPPPFFFGVVASASASSPACANAALNISGLDCFCSGYSNVPSEPGRPWYFCQSPVTLSSASTGSVGWAPTPSQYCARSDCTSIMLGCCFGSYLPIVSMALPPRRVCASATITRQKGSRISTRRCSLILTATGTCLPGNLLPSGSGRGCPVRRQAARGAVAWFVVDELCRS